MTKIIALTGATGFVGGHLLEALISQGFKVKALTRRPQSSLKNVTWISGDFENCAALKELVTNVDVIINVAGLVKAKSKNDFLKANGIAVSNLLSAIDNENTPHIIQMSSLAAREPNLSDYAYSKQEGEKVISNSPYDWTIIRPPGIYGPRD
ncbi:MAG: NAD(P)-dependent oxidoreductase, partial [Emcibacteraceae bacterium]|nr:NAD(P)-dependent oxidoreductase [Emcibacteraceae bacterium]